MEALRSRPVLSIFIFSIIFRQNIISSKSSKMHKYICEVRFEIAPILKKEVTCDQWLFQYPMCNADIRIAFHHHPPYVYAGTNQFNDSLQTNSSSVQGILPEMLRTVFDICCLGCTNLTFVGPFDYTKKFNEYNPGATIVMPVETSKTSSKFFSMDYVYFLEVSGVSFFLPEMKHDAAALTANLFQSVLSTWPLFVTALLMAVIAGIAIWMMDTWFNPDEFPRSFLRGPFEGFWWAFVSMTTVGYGDRAPKSYFARFFAIIWIFLGITIFSMYTAAMTTALTKKVVTNKVSVSGKKIAVVNTTAAAYSGALKETAIIRGYGSIDEIIKAVKKGEVDGAGLDDNIANFYSEKLKQSIQGYDFMTRVPITGTAYGIVMRDNFQSKTHNFTKGALKHFFTTFFENNEDQREAIIAKAMSDIKKVETVEPGSDDTSVFSYKSPIFLVTLLSLFGIGGTLIIAGLMIQYILFKRNKRNAKEAGNNNEEVELINAKFDSMEVDFIEEARELCKRWRDKYESNASDSSKPVSV